MRSVIRVKLIKDNEDRGNEPPSFLPSLAQLASQKDRQISGQRLWELRGSRNILEA